MASTRTMEGKLHVRQFNSQSRDRQMSQKPVVQSVNGVVATSLRRPGVPFVAKKPKIDTTTPRKMVKSETGTLGLTK